MSTTDTPATVRPASSRRLVLTMAVTVALLCTGAAFEGMFGFGRDMLGWNLMVAIAFAGIFELAQLTVALLAREAMRDGRPAVTLLTITWMLAAASGVLAAWEEIASGHGLAAALFRILAPVLAAGLWHLVLLGDRHLAQGRSWAQMRAAARMHALFLTVEDAARAHESGRGIARAEARRRRARAIALRTVPPEQMRAHVADWLDSLSAVADAVTDVARLHVETNQRVAGTLPAAPVVSGPDYTDRTAGAITAEVAAIDAHTARVRAGHASGHESGQAAGRSGGQSGRSGASVRPARRTSTRRAQRPARPSRAETAARMAVVSALVSARPDVTGPDVVSALREAGHDVADGVARRYLRNVRAEQTSTDTTTTDTPTTDTTTPDTDTTTAETGLMTSTPAPAAAPVLAEVN